MSSRAFCHFACPSAKIAVFTYTRHYQYVVALNTESAALRSPLVRRALNIGFEREVCLDIAWAKPLKLLARSCGIRVKHNVGAVRKRRKAGGHPSINIEAEFLHLQVVDYPGMEEAAKVGGG